MEKNLCRYFAFFEETGLSPNEVKEAITTDEHHLIIHLAKHGDVEALRYVLDKCGLTTKEKFAAITQSSFNYTVYKGKYENNNPYAWFWRGKYTEEIIPVTRLFPVIIYACLSGSVETLMYLAENLEQSSLELYGKGAKNEVMRYSLKYIFSWDKHFERHLYYVFLEHIKYDCDVTVRLGKHLPTEEEYYLLFKDPNFPIFEHLCSTYLNQEEQKKLIRSVYQELRNTGLYRDELAAWGNKFGNGLESSLKDNNSPDMPQLHSRQALRAEEKKISLFESQSAFFGAVKEKEPEERTIIGLNTPANKYTTFTP